jgi:uncharacterized protein YbjT (DUF2867 family)
MTDTKIIAVTGATGAQGGGLIRAILAHPDGGFSARAITRNPDSEKAQALAALGVEVVKGDLDDEASLAQAFAGAYGAYCVTNFWEHFSPEKEIEQAANLARAAKTAGVSHVIWSTLEDVRDWVPLGDDRMPTISERYKVPHFDAKGEANHFFGDAGVPTTLLNTSFYWDNLIYFGMGPKAGDDGVLAITFPLGDKKLAGIAAGDIGGCAYGIFAVHRQDGRDRGWPSERPGNGRRPFQGAGQGGPLQRRQPRRVPVVRLSRSRGTRQHVPVQRRVLRPVLCRSQP